MFVRGANHVAFGFVVVRADRFKRCFRCTDFRRGALHFGVHVAHARVERREFGVQRAKFTFHA